jgi:hypothetical protein
MRDYCKEFDEEMTEYPPVSDVDKAAWYGFLKAFVALGKITPKERKKLVDKHLKLSIDEQDEMPV